MNDSDIDLSIYSRSPLRFQYDIPVFSNPNRFAENYERIYSDHFKGVRSNLMSEEQWQPLDDSTSDLIQKYAPATATILDVGVGLGGLLSRFPNMKRYGLDISWTCLRQAKDKNITVCYSFVEDLPYKKEVFDAVVCTDFLEHALRLDIALENILSALKTDGVLIIRVPYKEDLRPYTKPGSPYEYAHVRSFDEYSLQLLFTKSYDCWVEEIRYSGGTLSSPKARRIIGGNKKAKDLIVKALLIMTRHIPSVYRFLVNRKIRGLEVNMVIRKASNKGE